MTEAQWNDLILKVNQIHQGIYGVPDTDEHGLCGDIKSLQESHNKLDKRVWWLIGILSGGGTLAAGGIGIAKIIGG